MGSFSFPSARAGMKIDSGDGLSNYDGDWTVEGWGYMSIDTDSKLAYGSHDYGGERRMQIVLRAGSSIYNGISLRLNDTWPIQFAGGGFPLDTWTHWAAVRESDTVAVFFGGNRQGTASWSATLDNNTSAPAIGVDNSTNYQSYGDFWGRDGGDSYLEEIRVSDVARYSVSSSSYTVPTNQFSVDANTNVLVRSGDWDGSSSTFTASAGGNITLLPTSTGANITDDGSSAGLGPAVSSGFMSLVSKFW